MGTTYTLEHAKVQSNVATYGVTDATGLVVGAKIDVHCSLSAVNVTGATITSVTGNDLTVALVHANIAKTTVVGQLEVIPVWCNATDVETFLGVPPATQADEDWLDISVAAANVWAFERRQAAGYSDLPMYVPNSRVKSGVVMLAAELYRGRGNVGDSFVSFDGLPAPMPVGQLGQVMRMLGLQKAGIG